MSTPVQPTPAQVAFRYARVCAALNYRWPVPDELCPAQMLLWVDMSEEQKQFWTLSFHEMQQVIFDLY